MKRIKWMGLGLVAAAAAFTACSDSTSPVTVETDAQLTADVAVQSGDAVASDLDEMLNNETSAGLPVAPSFDLFGMPPGVTVNRTKVCYSGNVAQACDALTTDSVTIAETMDGSFSRTNTGPHGTESMLIGLHRTRNLTISGLTGTETSRTHNGLGTAHDTTAFAGTTDNASRSRTMTLAAQDSIQAIVFNLPHNSTTNRWPASGKFIRNVTGKIVIVGGPNAGERTFTRRVEVDFPPDASGNVTLKVNDKTCNLNLNTHAVTNCT